MGRSVSTPSNAVGTVFLHQEDGDYADQWQWNEFIDDLKEIVRECYPSFEDCDSWLGRENHAILENGHAFITVSEYGGLVAICLVPQTDLVDYPELSWSWCECVCLRWEKYIESRYKKNALRQTGTMSNGVGVFEHVH